METTRHGSRLEGTEQKDTLPGMGPQLGVEHLRRAACGHGGAPLSGGELSVAEVMRAQERRYQWFCERVQRVRPADALAAVLFGAPRRPGRWEEALVELSLSRETTAAALLEQWQPPEHDPALCLFYQICRTHSRRRA